MNLNKGARGAFPTNLNWFVKNLYFRMRILFILPFRSAHTHLLSTNLSDIGQFNGSRLESILNSAKNQC